MKNNHSNQWEHWAPEEQGWLPVGPGDAYKPSPCPISLSIPQQPTPMQLKCLTLPDCRLLLILEMAWWRCEITEVLNRTEVWVLFCLLFEFRSSSQIEFFGIRWWKCVMCRIFKRSWHLERQRRGSWAGKQEKTCQVTGLYHPAGRLHLSTHWMSGTLQRFGNKALGK